MGVGPNYVLGKGHVATGSTAYRAGEIVAASGDGTKVARATTANSVWRGVCMEDVDAAKVTTGKVVLGVQMMGIVRVLAGAAIAVGDHLANDTTARAVPKTKAAAGAQPGAVGAIALTAATAAGQYVDALLIPGGQF